MSYRTVGLYIVIRTDGPCVSLQGLGPVIPRLRYPMPVGQPVQPHHTRILVAADPQSKSIDLF